jgi:hypothetical protein
MSVMKNLIFCLVICLIWIGLLTTFSPAQDAPENLLDKVSLKFSLSGEPTPESVGFDNSKSYWALEYELVLNDSFTLEKIGRCHRNENYKFICPLNTGKKLDKQIRKISTRIAKGKFKKQGLLADSSRDIEIPIQLSAEVIDIFNKAVTADNNPTFVLFVKAKIYTKTSDKVKFKKKFSGSGNVYPLKFYKEDKTFNNFWNIRTLGVSFSLQRRDNIISGFGISRY